MRRPRRGSAWTRRCGCFAAASRPSAPAARRRRSVRARSCNRSTSRSAGSTSTATSGFAGSTSSRSCSPTPRRARSAGIPARDPITDQPLKDAGAAELTFAFGMAGGGTPTNYRRTAFGGGSLPAGADAQRVDYDGVTLDAAKPTVAVVYAGRKGPAPSGASSHPVRVTLRAKLDGRPYDSPLVRELTRLSEIRQLFVTAAERRDALFGVQFQLPASWMTAATGGRLDLEADIALAPLLGFGEQSQCGGEAQLRRRRSLPADRRPRRRRPAAADDGRAPGEDPGRAEPVARRRRAVARAVLLPRRPELVSVHERG